MVCGSFPRQLCECVNTTMSRFIARVKGRSCTACIFLRNLFADVSRNTLPEHEQDRCHRIGQTKPVTVIKMVAQGTVDEDIYSMGERKKEVNKSVLNDAAAKEQDATSTISGAKLIVRAFERNGRRVVVVVK